LAEAVVASRTIMSQPDFWLREAALAEFENRAREARLRRAARAEIENRARKARLRAIINNVAG
jgi:hypothetical protein